MKFLILGGDGFCGWPTSLHLSQSGHDVTIVDNLSRRCIDVELEVESLTPVRPIHERLDVWKDHTGKEIGFVNLDLAREYDRLVALLREVQPDAIVHFAEQRAAPYSMRSEKTKRYTVDNNITATHNMLCAIVESGLDIAVVHLGTMGVYGYGWSGSAPIPEGYLTVHVPTPDGQLEREILHPANPGSIYHMTKTLDQLLFAFYAKNDGVRITDLHQGIVWGTQTPETVIDERLINRFDYDGDYGTVLNRFIMQAAIGHPLTVHGTGGQTRAFIHIRDTVRCIEIALKNPPAAGEQVSVFNQVTETYRVRGARRSHLRADRRGDRLPSEPPQGGRGERSQCDTGTLPGVGPQSHHPVRGSPRGDQRGRRQVRLPSRFLEDRGKDGLAGRHGSLTGPASLGSTGPSTNNMTAATGTAVPAGRSGAPGTC